MNRATLIRAGITMFAAAAASFALAALAATAPVGPRLLPAAATAPFAQPAVVSAAETATSVPNADQTDAAVPNGAGITISVKIDELPTGKLTITPPTGTDTTMITVTTDGPCPASSDSFSVGLSRTDQFSARRVTLAELSSAGFSTTAPIIAPLQRTLREAGALLGAPLPAGEYQLVLACVDSASNTVRGLFVGALYLTSPTTYQTTKPGPTPTTTAVPTTTPGPTPTHSSPTSTAVPPVGSPGGGSASAGGRVAYTGAPVDELFFTGLALSGLGAALLFAARRRTVPTLTEES